MKLWASKLDEDDDFEIASLFEAMFVVPPSIVALNLLQLLCEGGCVQNKNILREQIGNTKIVSVLGSLASFLSVLSRNCRFAIG